MTSPVRAGLCLAVAVLLGACGKVDSPLADAPRAFDAAAADAATDAAPAAKLVFISSATFFADLGGPSGADAACQNLANGAGLPGVFRAWISSAADPVAGRFTRATVPYTLVDGTPIASDWADLIDGSLGPRPIELTEAGQPLSPMPGITCHGAPTCSQTFTGTDVDGSYLDSQGANCASWTSRLFNLPTGGLGTFTGGDSTLAGPEWTVRALGFRCDYQARLYCFQQ